MDFRLDGPSIVSVFAGLQPFSSSKNKKMGKKASFLLHYYAVVRAVQRTAGGHNGSTTLAARRSVHVAAIPPPFDGCLPPTASSPPLVLPESDPNPDSNNNNNGFAFPSFSVGGSMELMGVPRKKTTPHKKGIRNGPKALKPIPVIIRCKSCGRVKLQHFFCCSGDRGKGDEQNTNRGTN